MREGMSMKKEEADVVIVGGGPAGIAAAIAAGRQGIRTVLVERYGFVGGMSTAAMVYPWMTFHTERGEQVIKGIAQEIVDRLQARGGSRGICAIRLDLCIPSRRTIRPSFRWLRQRCCGRQVSGCYCTALWTRWSL